MECSLNLLDAAYAGDALGAILADQIVVYC